MNHPNELSNVEKIKQLLDYLNLQRNAYYNENSPNISDAEYDRIFDELVELEKQTGFILSNSPTQTVGYTPISELPKVKHPVPLLSLDKTKQVQDLISFAGKQPVLFMLKLDGLTTKLVYENGTLVEASTRGDGEIGELITHNIPAYVDVPLSIPYKGRLVMEKENLTKMGEIWLLALCEVLIRQIVQDAVCTLCLLMFWKVWTLHFSFQTAEL